MRKSIKDPLKDRIESIVIKQEILNKEIEDLKKFLLGKAKKTKHQLRYKTKE